MTCHARTSAVMRADGCDQDGLCTKAVGGVVLDEEFDIKRTWRFGISPQFQKLVVFLNRFLQVEAEQNDVAEDASTSLVTDTLNVVSLVCSRRLARGI